MNKAKVLALVSNGVEEMELVITVDILRRAGIDVDIVSIGDEVVQCSRLVKIVADKVFNKVVHQKNLEDFLKDYDALFIPGGASNAQNLKSIDVVNQIIKHFFDNNKIIAAICAGPTVINHHYSLKNYKATCYPSLKNEIDNYMDEAVVIDSNLITSQGPATTFYFALSLVEKLKNRETRMIVSQATLFDSLSKIYLKNVESG